MNNVNKIRALKDGAYRKSLSDSQRAQVGENPAGAVELDEATLEMVGGAYATPHQPGSGAPPGTFWGACCLN